MLDQVLSHDTLKRFLLWTHMDVNRTLSLKMEKSFVRNVPCFVERKFYLSFWFLICLWTWSLTLLYLSSPHCPLYADMHRWKHTHTYTNTQVNFRITRHADTQVWTSAFNPKRFIVGRKECHSRSLSFSVVTEHPWTLAESNILVLCRNTSWYFFVSWFLLSNACFWFILTVNYMSLK